MTKQLLPKLSLNQTALLIVDMQNDFCKPTGYIGAVKGMDMRGVEKIIPSITRLLEFARENGLLTVFIKTIHSEFTNSDNWKNRYKWVRAEKGLSQKQERAKPASDAREICAPSTWGSEMIDELQPRDDEPIVVKHRYSAFIDTDLELILRSKGINNVLITGNATNVCVESTARHAFMLNYVTVTVSDCVGTTDEPAHAPSLWNLENYFGYVAPSKQVIESLEGGRLNPRRISRVPTSASKKRNLSDVTF